MTLVHLPREILALIVWNLALEDVVALFHTNALFRGIISDFDTKEKVLERVPWMEIGQIGTDLESWLDAAMMIVGWKKSFVSESIKWIPKEKYAENLEKIIKNTDIAYVTAVECENLPTTFTPMFKAEMPTSCGALEGKYMEELVGETRKTRFVDMTSMQTSETHPDPAQKSKTWSGWYEGCFSEDGNVTSRVPFSDLWVINKGGKEFVTTQTSERWILVRIEQNVGFYAQYLLDKSTVTDDTLYFNSETGDYARVYEDSEYTCIHLLPGSVGTIRFLFDEDDLFVSYDDVAGDKGEVFLLQLPTDCERYVEIFNDAHPDYAEEEAMGYRGSARQLVVTYGGVLYLHLRESVLIPLWVDLQDVPEHGVATPPFYDEPVKVAVGGLRKDIKSLLLDPEEEDESEHQAYGIVRSEDKRWAMQILSCGHIVVDLATQRSYITRPTSEWDGGEFNFVGVDKGTDLPVFYRVRMDGSKGTTGSYLKHRHQNKSIIPLDYTVIDPNMSDQSEGSVPLQ